ncbi:L antigen family member 3 [Plakobranchus ocellatus]|uniref:L antigen family member 3 n=1 Tax=Plakobranchus ocellatus TaxID=259542 RepID=A0AAV4DZC7_9GAST|nr:L antigen family member 3 [Plakobranchus ocellatus]
MDTAISERLSAELRVPFPSAWEAEVAYNSLSVDKEPKRGHVHRDLSLDGNIMQVCFQASEARTLRVSINSFFEHLKLVCETIDQFRPL